MMNQDAFAKPQPIVFAKTDVSAANQITPPVTAFAAAVSSQIEIDFGQVRIRRLAAGFELRHIADRLRKDADLQLVAETELRRLAQFTASGAFRPLKSAPSLRTGWRAIAQGDAALGSCLNHLYPGAVADWFAMQPAGGSRPTSKITSYREFTNRQTGMYRITTMLDDATAAAMIRACCHPAFCLKQRLWTINGSLPAPDVISQKSLIPCLEPCAILLEFARKITRVEQEEKSRPSPSPAEITRLRDAALAGSKRPHSTIAESDFDAPRNPRRLRFILEKHGMAGKPQ